MFVSMQMVACIASNRQLYTIYYFVPSRPASGGYANSNIIMFSSIVTFLPPHQMIAS